MVGVWESTVNYIGLTQADPSGRIMIEETDSCFMMVTILRNTKLLANNKHPFGVFKNICITQGWRWVINWQVKNGMAYIKSRNTQQPGIQVNGWKYFQYWVYHDYTWKDDYTMEVKGTFFLKITFFIEASTTKLN